MPQLFDQLRDFLAEVENEKQASVKKRAEANTETTAQGGPTTHPSKSQDDGTLPASEGKRSQENTGDVKDTIPAGGVDSAADKAPAQADQQHNVGITSTATGEDPSNEDNYKEKKDDPGTDHAAKAGEGEKYSSLSYGQLRKLAADKANNILADIIKSAEESAAEEKAEEKKELKGDQPKLDVNNNGKIEGSDLAALRAGKKKEEPKMAAARAGQAAASLTEQDQAELVKAAHAAVSGSLESTIADGLEKAAMVGAYLQSFYKAAAEGEAAGGSSEETHESPEQESSESPEEEAAEHASEEGGMDILRWPAKKPLLAVCLKALQKETLFKNFLWLFRNKASTLPSCFKWLKAVQAGQKQAQTPQQCLKWDQLKNLTPKQLGLLS
jgi:hypothetical protein